jgi:adenine-specific DNA-methyltransferase
VDKILAAKQANPQADTSAWEQEIDEPIYRLYGLTPEEIKIVEESTMNDRFADAISLFVFN